MYAYACVCNVQTHTHTYTYVYIHTYKDIHAFCRERLKWREMSEGNTMKEERADTRSHVSHMHTSPRLGLILTQPPAQHTHKLARTHARTHRPICLDTSSEHTLDSPLHLVHSKTQRNAMTNTPQLEAYPESMRKEHS